MLKPLGRALGNFRPGEGEGEASHAADPVVLLAAGWDEIVGADVAKNCHPSQVVGDALLVVTRSSGWSQQLSFLADQIVAAVRARVPRAGIERLRFRVGKLPARREKSLESGHRGNAVRRRGAPHAPAASAEEAIERFRAAVDAAQRAKRALGWNECRGCTALIAPGAGAMCVSCTNESETQRDRFVARLLFEAPWLGYAGTEALVERLTPTEYEAIRRRVLSRWWEILSRAAAAKRLSRDGRERLIASSYVILKSRLAPERIVPATVRNLLGDEVHDLIYETER